jgi:uncharacterized protein involved in cysteine biosynthesis
MADREAQMRKVGVFILVMTLLVSGVVGLLQLHIYLLDYIPEWLSWLAVLFVFGCVVSTINAIERYLNPPVHSENHSRT